MFRLGMNARSASYSHKEHSDLGHTNKSACMHGKGGLYGSSSQEIDEVGY